MHQESFQNPTKICYCGYAESRFQFDGYALDFLVWQFRWSSYSR
ncbi:hypothetical protein COO91_09117 (plasmid) [Nostoc flagelliforme CCNUN1]|uniref:Uncharacterized protein n=1 Tax=Nostoc flagelliforme CCNUN1 TaxID=2038116 RepID=A0A2K8T5V6_9NOSO|nr:hypothetical protein COO91_09117 [Nostoc flagelliforme CCNUN1]